MEDDSTIKSKLVAILQDKTNTRIYTADMSALLAFGRPFAEKIVSALEAFSRTRAIPVTNYAHPIAKWGECISSEGICIEEFDLDDPESLDELHLIFLEWYFTNSPSSQKSKFETKKRDWTNMGCFIKFCQLTHVLPKWDWYQFPKKRNPGYDENTKTEPGRVLGNEELIVEQSIFFEKIITTHSLVLPTNEYLEALQADIESNMDLIISECFKMISQMKDGYEEGVRLSAMADIDILSILLQESLSPETPIKKKRKKKKSDKEHYRTTLARITSPIHTNGLSNALWWIKNRFKGHLMKQTATFQEREEIKLVIKHGFAKLQNNMGIITHERLIPFITLIICTCSEVSNLEPVLNIKVNDITEVGNNYFRISAIKNRAKSMKTDLLEIKVKNAIDFLIERTNTFRRSMMHDPNICDSVFIGLKSDAYAGVNRR